MTSHASSLSGEMLREKQAILAEDIADCITTAQPNSEAIATSETRAFSLQNAHENLESLADSLIAGDPALFAHHLAWMKVLFGKRGMEPTRLVRNLEFTRSTLAKHLHGEAAAVALEYLNTGLNLLPSFSLEVPSFLKADAPRADLARSYLKALIGGQRHLASRLILEASEAGVPVRELYLDVFQPVQHEVGRLWQLNEISVAQEHYCTAATQLIMSQLYPLIFAAEKGAGTLVATCVSGDLHEIGVRMVADFFELEGWNTFYLGANTPPDAVIETVIERRADVLGISVTIVTHIRAASELIRMMRAESACSGVKILVGGQPFALSPDLWRNIGADGMAGDAAKAVSTANAWVKARGRS